MDEHDFLKAPPREACVDRSRMGLRERLACALLAARHDYPIKPATWRYWPEGDVVCVEFPGEAVLFARVRLGADAARIELERLGSLERAEEVIG